MKNFGKCEYTGYFIVFGKRLWSASEIKMWLLSKTVCKFKGHKWTDFGFANAECGCIDMECTRCGHSTGTIWLY